MNLCVVGAAIGLIFIPLGWLAAEGYPQLASVKRDGGLDLEWWMWLPAAIAAFLGLMAAIPDLLFRIKNGQRKREAWSARLIGLAFALALLLLVAPQLILWSRQVDGISLSSIVPALSGGSSGEDPAATGTDFLKVVNVGAILAAAAGALRGLVARKRSFFVLGAAAIAGPLAVITPALWVVNSIAAGGYPHGEIWLAICFVFFGLFWLGGDLTQWSLHPFYRRRLRTAFFVKRMKDKKNPDGERVIREVSPKHMKAISELPEDSDDFPELIVCAAANISDKGVTPPGRAATPFIFTRKKVGGPLIGVVDTGRFEEVAHQVSRLIGLPSAVAMSGAAVSPVMGRKTIKAVSFLMALTNVRLGVWVPNPRWIDEAEASRFEGIPVVGAADKAVGKVAKSANARQQSKSAADGEGAEPAPPPDEGDEEDEEDLDLVEDAPRQALALRIYNWVTRQRATPFYLFKELFGRTSVDDRFLYVTDGGHYDNLGLLELFRRGCTQIICLDAGGDKPGTYRALGDDIALARSDLQVDVEIDPHALDPNEDDRLSERDHVIGRFRYRATRDQQEPESAEEAEESQDRVGTLVYCRAAVTSEAPWDVRAFHQRDKAFPNHSTVDQLFNDEKFESYRALGAHTASVAIKDWERETAKNFVNDILRETARSGRTIPLSDLVTRVQKTTPSLRQRDLRLLVDQIACDDREANRPPLSGLILDGDEAWKVDHRVVIEIHEYWGKTVSVEP